MENMTYRTLVESINFVFLKKSIDCIFKQKGYCKLRIELVAARVQQLKTRPTERR